MSPLLRVLCYRRDVLGAEAAGAAPKRGVEAGWANGLLNPGVDCAGVLAPKLKDDPNKPPEDAGADPNPKPLEACGDAAFITLESETGSIANVCHRPNDCNGGAIHGSISQHWQRATRREDQNVLTTHLGSGGLASAKTESHAWAV